MNNFKCIVRVYKGEIFANGYLIEPCDGGFEIFGHDQFFYDFNKAVSWCLNN